MVVTLKLRVILRETRMFTEIELVKVLSNSDDFITITSMKA